MRVAPASAWAPATAGIAVAGIAVTFVGSLLHPSAEGRIEALWVLWWVGLPIVGALVVARRPDNRVGWLLLGIGVGIGVGLLAGVAVAPLVTALIGCAAIAVVLTVVRARRSVGIARLQMRSELLVAAATLAAVGAFMPVRRRVRARVDRHFNRSGFEAHRLVERFAVRVRDEFDVEDLLADPRGVVAATVEPAHVWLWTGSSDHMGARR